MGSRTESRLECLNRPSLLDVRRNLSQQLRRNRGDASWVLENEGEH